MQSHGKAAAHRPIHAPQSRSFAGAFGRLFRELPAWEPDGEDEAAKIATIATIAGEMEEQGDDAKNDMASIPAGYTFFGQFVDHDLTFDPRSSLQRANDPDNLENFRTPAFDLDCVYGRGPDDQPYLYDGKTGRKMMLIGQSGNDLPRLWGTAVIGDMRNDENTIISQLQLVFLKFHNEVVKKLQKEGCPDDKVFAEAQRMVRWHYQWVVIHDWLKRLCGKEIVDDILDPKGGGRYGKPNLCIYHYRDYPFIPVEFSVAAYRLGHSMMRAQYKLNAKGMLLPLFKIGAKPGEDLRGFMALPTGNEVEWCHLLEFKGKTKPQASRKIDRNLCSPVIHMPDEIAGPVKFPGDKDPVPHDHIGRSLAFRNLLRSWRLGLPSGLTVARRIGAKNLLKKDQPLWRYMLDEAEQFGKGERLGEVGARITAETFIGLLAGDPSSFYSTFPAWTPELPKEGANFELRDIVKFSKAPL